MRRAFLTTAVAALCCAPPALATDPGMWIATSTSMIPTNFQQGLAGDVSGNVFFSGPFAGIHRTRNLVEVAGNSNPIPPDVAQREQYNHIGDIAWDPGENGRILLPLESYQPFQKDQNPSKTGSFGVMSAATLKWSYYVKLDPSEIAKAQWVATAPDGLAWTVSHQDLLAYRLADVNPGSAAPNAAPIHSVQKLAGAVPNGAGGAAVLAGRLYMSGSANGADQLTSVDLAAGTSRLEYEQPGSLEAEGVDVGAYLGGVLHVEYVQSLSSGHLVNLLPRGAPLALKLSPGRVHAGKTAKVKASVLVVTNGFRVALAGVQVKIGRSKAVTDKAGNATLKLKLTRGLHAARASYTGLRSSNAKLRAT